MLRNARSGYVSDSGIVQVDLLILGTLGYFFILGLSSFIWYQVGRATHSEPMFDEQ